MNSSENTNPPKASKNRPTRIGVEERRQRIAKLMIRGLTPSQILKALEAEYSDLTAKTVENDIASINKQIRQTITELDVEAEVGKMLASYCELEREAWKGLHSAKQPKERTSGIKALSEVLSARSKLLERAGLLMPIQRVVHEHGDTWEEKVQRLRAARGLDQQREQEDDSEVVPLNEWAGSQNPGF